MKKNLVRAAIVLVVVAAIVFGPCVAWKLKTARTLEVRVVDKTVPYRNYREHAALPWMLRAMKVKQKDGRFLGERDYIGFEPHVKRGHDLEARHLQDADVLFVSDTYGVYQGDYEVPGVAALERSPRIYGGVSEDEALAMEAFAERGRMIVAEFNTFASPTAEAPRKRLEALFGARWTGWVGRYWADLQDPNEVPKWVGRVYEHVYHAPFAFKGGGYVLVREDQDMVVLRPDEDIDSDVIAIERTPEAPDLAGLPESGSFRYWLDVLERLDSDVVYEHRLRVTPKGEEKLRAHGIPVRFPALVRRRGRAVYYFAGDFVDSGVDRGSAERAGILWWRRIMLGSNSSLDESFFWGWYAPIVQRLVESRLP